MRYWSHSFLSTLYLKDIRCIEIRLTNYVLTPMASEDPLKLQDGSKPTGTTHYCQTICILHYFFITRPTILYMANCLAQYMQSLSQLYLQTTKRLLKYLKETIYYGLLLLHKSQLFFHGYINAEWTMMTNTQLQYLSFFQGKIPIFECKKAMAIGRSSTKADYRTLALPLPKCFGSLPFSMKTIKHPI